MSYPSAKAAAARREAQTIWTSKQKQREARAVKERERDRQAATQKIDHLRELRLAKETADKEAAEKAAAEKKIAATTARLSKRARKKAPEAE